jgi:glycosyltransferase involved in cell wall biosynthesis
MKVILIRSRAIDQAVFKIAQSLSKNGHDVTLLVWDRQNDLIIDPNIPYKVSAFKLRAPYDRFIALIYLPFWWIHEFIFLIKNDFDVLHACDLDTIFPAIFLKRIIGFKLCYIIYDFSANNMPEGKFEKLRKLFKDVVASIEKYCIGFSDILFLVDESRLEEVKHSKIKKVVYLYNSPQDEGEIVPQFERGDDGYLIFYAGLILKSRGLEYMINAVNELDNFKLILAGKIPDDKIMKNANLHRDKISYIGWLPTYKDVILKTLEADILFRFSDPKHPKTKYESPNKLFEAMMCEKPIIVSDGSSMANIVRKENCGFVVPYGDVQAIIETMLKLKNDPSLGQKLGRNGRMAYDGKYPWNIMEKRLDKAYTDLAESRFCNKK